MTNEPLPPAKKPVRPLIIYLIAGEASGDLLGAHLMRSIKAKLGDSPVLFYGIGGDKMAAEGLSSLFPYYELSMMGFIEILPYAFNLAAKINYTAEDIMAKKPDAVVTIDSPGFCFRVVKRLRKEKFKSKFVHYVAPSVWAYKPERAQKCADLFDHLLTLLPFEPSYFEKVGLKTTWVGHPVVAETSIGNAMAFRERYQIAPHTKLFTLMPGSRKGEVERHMPILAKAVRLLASQYPDLAIAVTLPKNVLNFVKPYFEGCPYRAIITADENDKKDAIAASDLALVKSGTVALEVAMGGAPMVITYRVNPISAWLFKRVRITKYVNLVNILQSQEVIPELLQELCHPLLIADAGAYILSNPNARARQMEGSQKALAQLIPPNNGMPSSLAADIVLSLARPPKRKA